MKVFGVDEFAVEPAPVGSFVVKGDVGDKDGSVLQVSRLLAAVPAEAVNKTPIHDDARSVTETIQLGHGDVPVNLEWRATSCLQLSCDKCVNKEKPGGFLL